METRLEELKDFMVHAREKHPGDPRFGSHWRSGTEQVGVAKYPEKVLNYTPGKRGSELSVGHARPEPVPAKRKMVP